MDLASRLGNSRGQVVSKYGTLRKLALSRVAPDGSPSDLLEYEIIKDRVS
jgi:hypothetical protein